MTITQSDMEWLVAAIVPRITAELGDPSRVVDRRIDDSKDELGDVHEVARWLGCSVPTIERAARAGSIPSFKIGRLRRYRRADVLAAFERNVIGQTSICQS